MCNSPVSIPNPNYGKKFVRGDPFSLKDCTSRYIRVPCGHCDECIALKQMYIVQRVQMQSLNNYLFFATLTYNKESLPSITTSTGYNIAYADKRDLQNCFKRLRKSNAFGRPFSYLYVSERGGEKGRPHFHVLFSIPKYSDDDPKFTWRNLEKTMFDSLLFEWRRNYGSRRVPVFRPLCTYKCIWKHGRRYSNFDLHCVRPLMGDDGFTSVAFYVSKYMLKRSDRDTRLQQALHLNLSQEEYDDTWKIVRSCYVSSKGFGLNLSSEGDIDPSILEYLKFGISISEDFPKFFNPQTGQFFPLSRYYKSKGKIYSYYDALKFYNPSDLGDSVPEYDIKDYSQLLKSVSDYEKKISKFSDRGDYDSVADDFD